jgi:hypothetical protein
MSEKKLDHIMSTLADMLTMFGKRFDAIDDTLQAHGQILAEHSEMLDSHTRILKEHSALHAEHARDLHTIKNQLAQDLDKRKQLEVRVSNIEKQMAA